MCARHSILTIALWALLAPSHVSGEIIDRVFAVVDGALITQSDVLRVVRLGLAPLSPLRATDPVAATLEALIERRLMLAEVARYAPPDPPDALVEQGFEAIRARAGTTELDAALLQTGGGYDQLRLHLRDDLRIESYLQQRFGALRPTDTDIAAYYREHAAEFGDQPLQDVRATIVAELSGERRAVLIRDWVAGLRRRANINILPR